MNFVAVFMSIFSVLGGIDRIIGNRFGLGEKFEKGFMLFGNMALSMIGMIIISPYIAELISPILAFSERYLGLDPSIIPALIFANDMGGAPLASAVATDSAIGMYNALVVSSMMGVTISFTIPYALGIVKKEKHKDMFLGFLCGIVTIPIGCIVSGFILEIPFLKLVLDLYPIVILSLIITVGLLKCPAICVKIFKWLGIFMNTIITIGLVLGILKFLCGVNIIDNLDTIENGAAVCLNASIVMSGAFPFLHILSKLLDKPIKALGRKLKIDDKSALGFVSSIATSATTFEMMNCMEPKGVMLNSAFAISAAFTFAGHLAFTMAFNMDYVFAVIVGKLISGLSALLFSVLVYNIINKKDK